MTSTLSGAVPVETMFFGIGAQKSGTTWLHDFFSAHPEIHVPALRKEFHYWNRHLSAPYHNVSEPNRLTRLAQKVKLKSEIWSDRRKYREYRSLKKAKRASKDEAQHIEYLTALLSCRGVEKVVGEITPYYSLLDANDFRQMSEVSSNVVFLFVMRDPVDRLLSGLKMTVSRLENAVTSENIASAIDATLLDDRYEALKRSRYDTTLEKLFSVVPHESVALFFYETLFSQSEIDRLCRFLGVTSMKADVEKKVFSGGHEAIKVDSGQKAQLYKALADTYDALATRFGLDLPHAWKAHSEVAI